MKRGILWVSLHGPEGVGSQYPKIRVKSCGVKFSGAKVISGGLKLLHPHAAVRGACATLLAVRLTWVAGLLGQSGDCAPSISIEPGCMPLVPIADF